MVFAKVNADTASAVRSLAGIQAYPTFKVYKDGEEHAEMKGWQGTARLKKMIESAR